MRKRVKESCHCQKRGPKIIWYDTDNYSNENLQANCGLLRTAMQGTSPAGPKNGPRSLVAHTQYIEF